MTLSSSSSLMLLLLLLNYNELSQMCPRLWWSFLDALKTPVDLHLSKAVFSLDPNNLHLHFFLRLGALFHCSFFCPLDQPCKTLQMVQVTPKNSTASLDMVEELKERGSDWRLEQKGGEGVGEEKGKWSGGEGRSGKGSRVEGRGSGVVWSSSIGNNYQCSILWLN